MRRIHVVGTSGSGKSTLAKALAARRAIPYVELDAIRHGPNWVDLPDDRFREEVAAALGGDAWVVEGNYSAVRPWIWERADTVIWLDYPFPVVFGRVLRRTVRRCWSGEELWNGNRETFANSFLSCDGVVYWSVKTYRRVRRGFGASLPAWQAAAPNRTALHFRTPKVAAVWLKGL